MPEDTTVVVSVTERSERDLTKRFDDTSIDWAVIERQLVAKELRSPPLKCR
jgi:hypothetical protein